METSIIVAIITGVLACVGSIGGQLVIAANARKKAETEQAVRDERTKMRLDGIEAKLDIHNGYAARFEEVAVSLAELRTELRLTH